MWRVIRTGLLAVLVGHVSILAGSAGAVASVPLNFSTFLGGAADDDGFMAATDAAGNVYVSGWTDSANLPVLNAEQPAYGGSRDAFVAAFTPAGSPIYLTYLGGSGADRGYYIRADAAGNVFVAGATSSRDFPIANAIQPTYGGGSGDGFLSVLDATGKLLTSTYLGGRGFDAANLDAVDPTGAIYVAGNTASGNFPVTVASAQQPTKAAGTDTWVMRLDPSARATLWSTFLGGGGAEQPYGMQADAAGNVFVSTLTSSANFPTKIPWQPAYGGGQDVTLTKYGPAGQMSWSTYYGGSGLDRVNGVDVDPAGNVYIAGQTASSNLPTLHPHQSVFGGGVDGLLASFSGSSGALRYATYLGGRGADWFGGVVADGTGRAYVVGGSTTPALPTPGGSQRRNAGGMDAYVALLSVSGGSIVYGTYLGGSSTDGIGSAAFAPDGSLWLAGHTRSANFPTVPSSGSSLAGGWDAFVSHLGPVP